MPSFAYRPGGRHRRAEGPAVPESTRPPGPHGHHHGAGGRLWLGEAGAGGTRPRLRNGRQGMALVSLAGPIANVLVAAAFALPFHLGLLTIPQVWPPRGLDLGLLPAHIAFVGVFLNVVLAVFNLLPVYPLDGSSVLLGVTPHRWGPDGISAAALGASRVGQCNPVRRHLRLWPLMAPRGPRGKTGLLRPY